MNKLIETVDEQIDRAEELLSNRLEIRPKKVGKPENREEFEFLEAFSMYVREALDMANEVFEEARKPLYDAYRHVLDRKKEFVRDFEEADQQLRDNVQEYLVDTGEESEKFYLRDNWKARVTDFGALIEAVAAGEAPMDLLQVNTSFANETARTLKDMMQYDGIEAYNDKVLAIKAANNAADPVKESKD